LSLLLLRWYGFTGIAAAFAIVRIFAIVAVVFMVLQVVPVRLGGSIAVPLFASIAMAAVGYAVTLALPANLLTLILIGIAMAAIYVGLLWVFDARRLRSEIAELLVQFQPATQK
jgi:hypothetical protein